MNTSENEHDLTQEEVNALAERVHKQSNETLSLLNTELKAFEKYKESKDKFYNKFGFTEEIMQSSKNPPISEAEMDPAIQDFFNHFLKEIQADQAAQGISTIKPKRTGLKLSKRGKMI